MAALSAYCRTVLLLGAIVSSPLSAEMTKDVAISADIVAGCLVTSAQGGSWGQISFGSYAGIATDTINASLVSNSGAGIFLNCTPGMTASLTANTGTHAVSGVRYLAGSAGGSVAYSLFANGDSTAWTNQSVSLSFPTGTSTMTVPITARITLPGTLKAGAYTDTVQITLTW